MLQNSRDRAPSPSVQPPLSDHEAFLADVLTGLSQPRKSIPCKYFYDQRGSELFEAICALPEYYPTRTELGLLEAHAAEIAQLIEPGGTLVELGSGASQKVRLLLDAMAGPVTYLPVDISGAHLQQSAARLAADYTAATVIPICADYTQPFDLPELAGVRSGFFPGSTIGNFAPAEAIAFLKRTAQLLGPGSGLLIGVDLQKDPAILLPAYDDAAGVTAAFNLNLLARINRELGCSFDLAGFGHAVRYDPALGRLEMHLQSRRPQIAAVAGRPFRFAAGETIHTEDSHKYTITGFQALAGRAGWQPVKVWADPGQLFSIHFLRAAGAVPRPRTQAVSDLPT